MEAANSMLAARNKQMADQLAAYADIGHADDMVVAQAPLLCQILHLIAEDQVRPLAPARKEIIIRNKIRIEVWNMERATRRNKGRKEIFIYSIKICN